MTAQNLLMSKYFHRNLTCVYNCISIWTLEFFLLKVAFRYTSRQIHNKYSIRTFQEIKSNEVHDLLHLGGKC